MAKKTHKAKKPTLEKPQPPSPQHEEKKGAGRPRAVLDEAQVFKMRSYGHTMGECADFFGVHVDTLRDNFSTPLREGRAEFKSNIRKAQMREALKGNPRLLVHLGKTNLEEQKAVVRIEGAGGKPLIPTPEVNDEQVKRMIAALLSERQMMTATEKSA